MTTNRIEYVEAGERFRPHIRASSWNAFADAANWVKTQTKAERSGQPPTRTVPSLIDVLLAYDGAARLDVVGLDTIGIEPDELDHSLTDDDRPLLSGVEPTADHHGKFAILTEEADTNEVAYAIGSGCYIVRLWVAAHQDWIDRADVDPTDSTRLQADPAGSAQIIWKQAGESTEVLAIVRLGNPQNVSYRGYTLQTIAADGSGNVELYSDPASVDTGSNVAVNAHLIWMHGDQDVAANTEVIVTYFPRERKWIITHAACTTSALAATYTNKDGLTYTNKDAVVYEGP